MDEWINLKNGYVGRTERWRDSQGDIMRKVFIETFSCYEDAETFLSNHLNEHKDDWWVVEATIVFIRKDAWRAGVIFSKTQGELFDEL